MRRPKASGVGLALVAACVGFVGLACVAVAEEASTNTWAGVWASDFGDLTMDASGSGSYTGFSPGTVEGHVSGNVNEGTWRQPGNPPKQGPFKFTLSSDGKTFSGVWTYESGGCGSACGWNGTCKDGPCMNNGVTQATSTEPSTTSTTPSSFATVASFSGEVTFRIGGGPLRPLTLGTKLPKGAELQTGVDASVRLKFADGTIMKLDEMTGVRIADLLVKESRQAVTVQLKLGEVSATVNPKKAFQTDFEVKTDFAHAGVRGTAFSVFYDPDGKVTVVSTEEGEVSVDPTGAGLATTIVSAGKELVVRPTTMSDLQAAGTYQRRNGPSGLLVAVGAVLVLGLAAAFFFLLKRRSSATIAPE
jgi:hypothetical protein